MSSKIKTTAAKEEATPALVPKLRFPEFREAEGWHIKPFEKLFTIGNGRDHKHLSPGDVPVYGSGGYMRSVDEYLYDGESVCIGRKGTINNPIFLTGSFWTVDTLFYTHSFNQCLPKFIWAIFQQIDWLKHNEAGGIPSLSKTNIEKIKTAIPKPAEQQKITECLSSVDELMAAQARKVDALKTHKKGLMQQLFPREGETQPRLRFPEFQNAGEWMRRRLVDFADVSASGDLDASTFSPECSEEHCFPIYSNAVEKEGIYGFSSVARSKANSVTITARGTLGRAFLRTTDFVGIGRLIVVSNFEGEADSAFLKECWNHLAAIPQEVTSIPQLTAVAARLTSLPFPTLTEQQRIAECLSSLDAMITAATQQLEALKTHKKGLMQQLFPSPEEVAV